MCFSVVDDPEGETVKEKALYKEAVKAILSGATVFFPDKLNRRDKLFNMMVCSHSNACITVLLLFNMNTKCLKQTKNKQAEVHKVGIG